MMAALKGIAAKLGLLIAASLVAILVCEFVIRTFAPQVTMFPRFVESTEFRIALPKNAEVVHAQGDRWRFLYHTNELGRRGPCPPVANHYSTRNIVLLGDSFSFGYGVDDSDTFARAMALQLGPDYAVINGGMGGYGIDSEIKWYFKVGSSYLPSYVVLQFTGNDPTESYTGVTKVVDGEFVFSPYSESRPLWQRMVSESSIIQHSHLYSLLRNLEAAPKKSKSKATDLAAEADKSGADQQHYNEMLRLFAHKLKDANLALLFVSVTHPHDSTYHYDINDFPIIDREVSQLDSLGLLHFVELPLDQMRIPKGSPEGHQWSAEHHRMVGSTLASEIQKMEASAKAGT